MATLHDNLLGISLKFRRTKFDPATSGFRATFGRTLELRFERVGERHKLLIVNVAKELRLE